MRALSITLEALCRSLHDELKGIGTHHNSRGNEAEQRNITKKIRENGGVSLCQKKMGTNVQI